jgi:uncharacterized membrane protein YkoI
MKQTKVFLVAILGFTSVAMAESRISKSDLPAAVQKAAEAQTAGATVVGYAKDVEQGKLEYEVQLMVEGHTKDVTFDPKGNLLEVEEQVKPEILPAHVLSGLHARAGSGSITKIESLTKHGKIVAYEAQITTGKKHSEIQVGPDGQKLDHEE